ncbi:MAG: hypothetical protein WCZ90_09450 [Melioribacteraceae bacterium]
MKKAFIAFIAVAAILLETCTNNGTEPEERKIKSPLDMTWTYEVLSPTIGSQLMMSSIYGSSYKDIWICGHSSVNQGSLWHYDGSKWTNIDPLIGNEYGPVSVINLFGFSSTNIWLVGNRTIGSGQNERLKCLALNYNGTRWVDQKIETIGRLFPIYGDNPTNIWAGGSEGLITHFNGTEWIADTIKLKGVNPKRFGLASIIVYNGKPVIMAKENDGVRGINTFYITGDIDNWKVIDSNKVVQEQKYTCGDRGMLLSKTNRLFSFGAYGIWEWINSRWTEVFYGYFYIGGLCAVNDNYMIGAGNRSFAVFYNGSTWTQIPQIKNITENVQFEAVWTDGTEVFIVGYSTDGFPNKTYIWHGK